MHRDIGAAVGPGNGGALAVLELLAQDAPQARFDALLDEARASGADGVRLDGLTRALKLARAVRTARDADSGTSGTSGPGTAGTGTGTGTTGTGTPTTPTTDVGPARAAAHTALADTAHDLTSAYDLDALLRVVLRRAGRLLGLDVAWIALDRPDGTAYVRASEGGTTVLSAGLDLGARTGLGGMAQARRAPVWTADYPADGAVPRGPAVDGAVRAEGLRAVVAVPLRAAGDSTLGALCGAVRTVRRFTPDETGLLLSLADLAAVAVERAGQLERVRAEAGELERFGSRTNTALTRVRYLWECHARLAGLVLDGAGLPTVARATADALDGVLQVRDPGGRPLVSTGPLPAGLDEEAVARAALVVHTDRRPVELPGDVWLAPVLAGAEDLGVLVLHASAPLTAEDVRLLQMAAQTVAALVLIQRGTAAAEGPVHEELLQDLLDRSGRADRSERSDRHLLERTRRLGVELEEPHVVVVARPEGGELGKAVAWASSYAYRMNGLKGVRRGCIVLVLPGSDASAAARRVSAELSPMLGHPVSTGAAGPSAGAGEVARVYAEAVRCLDALTALDGAGGTASLSELGFLGLLLSTDHDVDAFIEATVGPVLAYDAVRVTELTRTLEAYFDSGGSPTHAAEVLHVHANTVSRRLDRIAELLGPLWQKPDRALEIQMALRLRKARGVLHDRRTEADRQRSGTA
ncbi:helix-turn-helix domain-containing protein [Streptomyces sp. NPDC002044]|uniref:helix-turn-helix domain-containing protein n=1 Tax=Streptomyces sp. NPDC002044 TaxID=3154662 RepID=UPI00333301AE